MHSHYKTLGLTNAALSAEIRRAYRVLARRYHPDVNPEGHTDDLFKEIAVAYKVLSDPEKRRQHDLELKRAKETFEETFQRAHEALKRNQSATAYAKQAAAAQERKPRPEQKNRQQPPQYDKRQAPQSNNSPSPSILTRLAPLKSALNTALNTAGNKALSSIKDAVHYVKQAKPKGASAIGQLALLEVSISMLDAIQGTRKTVDISGDPNQPRKVSIPIPAGVSSGSIVRFRNKERVSEEVVLIVQVERHPWLSIDDRGVTIEVPLTIQEAINGAKIRIPALTDTLLVTVEPNTQSGQEVRLRGQGVTYRDGSRGDLYARFAIMNPEQLDRQHLEALDNLYQKPVRGHLPQRILEPLEKTQ